MALTDYDPRLVADIKGSEADRLTAYQDPLGNWTCGYGHEMPPPAPGKSWEGFTVIQQTADGWLDADLQNATRYARTLPEWPALDTDARQNAVIELCFNLGGKWTKFAKCRAAIAIQDWQTAHDQLLWNVVPTDGVNGVPTVWESEVHAVRANRIANYLLTGEYT
jgi:GH24 family phage-related lysozyme (muramidase)